MAWIRGPQLLKRPNMRTDKVKQIARPDQTENEHLDSDDFKRVFDDYDTGSCKPGMPFEGLFGSVVRTPPKCTYCDKPMVLSENKPVLYCEHCRRQLRVEYPNWGWNYNPQMESGGDEMANNYPTPSEANFDVSQYRTKPLGDWQV